MTLGLVIDEMGFPKVSKIFPGNVSEPETLKNVIKELQGHGSDYETEKNITVVLDAGIAFEDNLTLLKDEGYDYVCGCPQSTGRTLGNQPG